MMLMMMMTMIQKLDGRFLLLILERNPMSLWKRKLKLKLKWHPV